MDPIEEILNAAVNPSASGRSQASRGTAAAAGNNNTNNNSNGLSSERKKKGLCISCGLIPTHTKKKGFKVTGGGWKPVDPNEPCYKEHLCKGCYAKQQQQQQKDGAQRQLSNSARSSNTNNDNSGGGRSDSITSLIARLPMATTTTTTTTPASLDDFDNGSMSSVPSLQGSFISNATGYSGNSHSTGRESTVGGGHYNIRAAAAASSSLLSSPNNNKNATRQSTQQRHHHHPHLDRSSYCARIARLPDSVWNVRADETLATPKESLLFPSYESTPAARHATVTVLDSFDPTCRKSERMYVVQLDPVTNKPIVAFRQVSYPPPSKLQHSSSSSYGRQLYCTRLLRTNAGGGFEDPAPRNKWNAMVMIKEIEKHSYYYSNSRDGNQDSPFKDAVVLQQIGGCSSNVEDDDHHHHHGSSEENGILNCTTILEDAKYIYLICPIIMSSTSSTLSGGSNRRSNNSSFCHLGTLADVGIRHPTLRDPTTFNAIKEEHSIKIVFRQLVKAVQHTHMHGVCHRNLDPNQSILLLKTNSSSSSSSSSQQQQQQSSTSSTLLLLSDFCCSILVPHNCDDTTACTNRRHLMAPGISGSSNRRYMAPEVYHHQIYDSIAADIWSLGVILFELLTGCKLHAHPTRMDPMYCFFVLSDGFLLGNSNNNNGSSSSSKNNNNNTIPEELFERMMMNNSNSSMQSGGSSSSSSQQMQDLLDSIDAVNQLSQSARNLLTDLLQAHPPHRLSIPEILNHPWFFSNSANKR